MLVDMLVVASHAATFSAEIFDPDFCFTGPGVGTWTERGVPPRDLVRRFVPFAGDPGTAWMTFTANIWLAFGSFSAIRLMDATTLA